MQAHEKFNPLTDDMAKSVPIEERDSEATLRKHLAERIHKLKTERNKPIADTIHSWLVRLGDPATPRSTIIAEMIEMERELRK